MSAAAAATRSVCIICRTPALVILGTLLASASAGAVIGWRLNIVETRITRNDGRIEALQQNLAELQYIKAAVLRIETKMDRMDRR